MRSFYEAFMLEIKFIFRLATTTFCTGHNYVLRELWQVVSQWTLFNYDFHVKGKSKFLEENYQRIPVNVANTMKRTHTIGKCRECRTIPALIHQIHQSYHHHKNVSLSFFLKVLNSENLNFQKLFGDETLDTVNEAVNDDDESDSGSSSGDEEGFERDEIELVLFNSNIKLF